MPVQTRPPAFAFGDTIVRAGPNTWRACCLDTRLIAGFRWAEVTLSGSPDYTVVLKISADANAQEARRALEWWLLSPGREDGDVIEVT